MTKIIQTEDFYGNWHDAKVEDLVLSVHIYGIALDGDRILIVPQGEGYDFPGGTMELGETIPETLRREVKEETGLDVEPKDLCFAASGFFHHIFKHIDLQGVCLWYFVEVTGGEISTAGASESEKQYAKEARWIPISDLRKLHHCCSVKVADEILDRVATEIEKRK